MPTPAAVEAYFAALEPQQRKALLRVRDEARKLAPDAVEAMSYGMPALKLPGKGGLAGVAAFKGHLSFFPMSGSVLDPFQDELQAKGFVTAKSTVQFTPEHPIPLTLLRRILKARLAEMAADGRRRRA